jgi:NitT/TauT family transport system substrate-binding protein
MTISRNRMITFLSATAGSLMLAPNRSAAQNLTVRVGTVTTDAYAQPFYAKEAGFFQKAGLNVELSVFTNGGGVVQAAAAGAIDVGLGDMIQIGSAWLRGLPFGFFMGSNLYTTDAPTTMLCVAKNAAISSAKDLEGQTIGLFSLRSMTQFATEEWLAQNGADPSTVRFVELPGSAMAASVARGTVAGAMLSEPFLSASRADCRPFGKCFDALAKQFFLNAWFARRDWFATRPEIARKLVGVAIESARWANTHQAQTASVLASMAKLDSELIKTTTRARYASSLDPHDMQPVLDIAYRYKALEKPIAAAELILKAPV